MVISCYKHPLYDSTCPSHIRGWIQDEVNQIHSKGGNSDDKYSS